MFKIHNEFSQVSFLDFFHNYNENNFYRLRSQPDFLIPRINSTLKGIESVQNFGPVMWNNIKNFDTIKIEIRKWKPANCSCRLYKTYVKNFGFINISQ